MKAKGVLHRVKRAALDRALRDASGKFDRMGLGVVNRHCLKPALQIELEPGKGSQSHGFTKCA